MTNKQLLMFLGGLTAGLGSTLLYAGWREQFIYEINVYRIGNSSGNGTLLRLLHLSDIHLRKGIHQRHYQLADSIRQLRPHLIMITGDALDKHGSVATLDQFLALLPRDIPRVAVMGNHDYRVKDSIRMIQQTYRRHGCDLLINASRTYLLEDTPLTITGLDDCIEGKPDFSGAVREMEASDHHLVLIHSPLQQEDILPEMERLNIHRSEKDQLRIHYLFAGHIHGGQVRPFGIAPYLPKRTGTYLKGWYNQRAPFLYVSKGFGTSFLPLRWGARSEITLFKYHA